MQRSCWCFGCTSKDFVGRILQHMERQREPAGVIQGNNVQDYKNERKRNDSVMSTVTQCQADSSEECLPRCHLVRLQFEETDGGAGVLQ